MFLHLGGSTIGHGKYKTPEKYKFLFEEERQRLHTDSLEKSSMTRLDMLCANMKPGQYAQILPVTFSTHNRTKTAETQLAERESESMVHKNKIAIYYSVYSVVDDISVSLFWVLTLAENLKFYMMNMLWKHVDIIVCTDCWTKKLIDDVIV